MADQLFERPPEVIMFFVGGVTYEEAKVVAQRNAVTPSSGQAAAPAAHPTSQNVASLNTPANAQNQNPRLLIGGTSILNSTSYRSLNFFHFDCWLTLLSEDSCQHYKACHWSCLIPQQSKKRSWTKMTPLGYRGGSQMKWPCWTPPRDQSRRQAHRYLIYVEIKTKCRYIFLSLVFYSRCNQLVWSQVNHRS